MKKQISDFAKTLKSNKVFFIAMFLLATGLIAMCIISGEYAISGVMAAMAAPAMVGTPVTETPTTANLDDAGISERDISKEITRQNPSRYPLDTMMREHLSNTVKAKSQEIDFYQVSAKSMVDTLDSSASGTGLTSSSPCSSYTYSADIHNNGTAKIYINPQNPDIWRKHDTLLMRGLTVPGNAISPILGAAGTAKYNQMFYVSGKDGGVLELTPVGGLKGKGSMDGKSVVPDFTSSQVLVRCAPAKSEKSLSSEPFANYPAKSTQYLQNFIVQIEESTFHALTKKEVEYGIDDMERDVLYSMRAEMENSFLFGEKYLILAGNDKTYFTGGITRLIDKVLQYGKGGGVNTITQQDYTNWMESVFTGNNGSQSRVLLAGSGLIKHLELLRESHKQINGNSSPAEVLGIKVVRMISTFGELNICHAPLFDESDWRDGGVILDMEHITKHVFVPMTASEMDLKVGRNPENATAKVIQEVSGLTLRYPECHAIISPKE